MPRAWIPKVSEIRKMEHPLDKAVYTGHAPTTHGHTAQDRLLSLQDLKSQVCTLVIKFSPLHVGLEGGVLFAKEANVCVYEPYRYSPTMIRIVLCFI